MDSIARAAHKSSTSTMLHFEGLPYWEGSDGKAECLFWVRFPDLVPARLEKAYKVLFDFFS